MKITKAKKNEYIKNKGIKCPICGSKHLEGGHIEVDAGGAWQEIGCNACNAEWNDIYKLVDVEIIN